MRKVPTSVKILVTSKKEGLAETVSTLKKHGMRIGSVLEEIGVISGDIHPTKLPQLKQLPGIKVEPDESVQLPPPDSPVQ